VLAESRGVLRDCATYGAEVDRFFALLVRADSYISTVARNLVRTAYKANAKEQSRRSDVDALNFAG
jgi:hypothetical protein